MARQLLVDYLPFDITIDQINESIKENNGRLVVHGVLQRADIKNQNGRVYPKEVLEKEVKNFNNKFVKEGKQIDTMFYPSRNHGIYGGNASFHLRKLMTKYFLEYLGN